MPSNSIPILCYHKVDPDPLAGRSLNIHPATLESHVRFMKRFFGPGLLAREFGSSWPTSGFCLTFDDAYLSTMSYGVEVLGRTSLLGTFYVVGSLVGRTSIWDGEKATALADRNLLQAALAQGHELGNHTNSHIRMNLSSQEVCREEILACRAVLSELAVEEESFCFPYGALHPNSDSILSDVGIKVGMALGKRVATPADSRLKLPRIVMAYRDSIPMLAYKLWVRPRLRQRKAKASG